MARILVTGANGFVGSHLMPLISSRRPRVALRSTSSEAPDSCERISVGEIDQNTNWDAALEGIDCVVHMAGRVHVMKPSADDHQRFHEVNVLGTERLALAAAERGAKRFIFLSSIKVNGEATFGNSFTAADPPNPVDDYGVSKLQAEIKLLDIAKRTNMEVVVIRPTLVYGPGVRANFLRLLSWVYKEIPLPFGAIRNTRSLVNVWNLCDLIQCVIDKSANCSGVFLVSDGVALSTPELIRSLARSMDRTTRLVSVPASVIKLAGAAVGKRAEVARLCGSLTVDIAATKSQLDWAPPVSTEEGLARTARWYLDQVAVRGN